MTDQHTARQQDTAQQDSMSAHLAIPPEGGLRQHMYTRRSITNVHTQCCCAVHTSLCMAASMRLLRAPDVCAAGASADPMLQLQQGTGTR
jgi:hypothetical protein